MKTLMYCVLLIVAISWPWSSVSAQVPVVIDAINVQTEFHGPFSKNRVEIIFFNPTNRDSLEGRCNLYLDRTSFVKELWLEINRKLKHAETLRRETGTRIYERVTGKRLDPALMVKIANGEYFLRVYPLSARQSRRVVIEYYAVLESDESERLSWKIHSYPPAEISIRLKTYLPSGAVLQQEGVEKSFAINDASPLAFEQYGKLALHFDFAKLTATPRIYQDEVQFFQFPRNEPANLFLLNRNLPYRDLPVPLLLEKIVKAAKFNQPIRIRSRYHSLKELTAYNRLAKAFLDFLSREKAVKITWENESYDADSVFPWYYEDKAWSYYDENLILQSHAPRPRREIYNIACPFLKRFIEYNLSLMQGTNDQARSGFLTYNTAKLVLEDNARVRQIWQQEIELEKKIYRDANSSKPQIPPPDFVPFEKAPQIVKKVQPVYPGIAVQARIEGKVWVKCAITVNGDVDDLVIAKSAHPVLDIAAMVAVSQFKFTPAMLANGPVPVWVSIPINFKLDDVDSGRVSSSKQIEFYGRNFLLQEFDGKFILIEDGCMHSNAKKIEYLSKTHFTLLYNHPELIKFSYYFEEICFCVDPSTRESVRITARNQPRRE